MRPKPLPGLIVVLLPQIARSLDTEKTVQLQPFSLRYEESGRRGAGYRVSREGVGNLDFLSMQGRMKEANDEHAWEKSKGIYL